MCARICEIFAKFGISENFTRVQSPRSVAKFLHVVSRPFTDGEMLVVTKNNVSGFLIRLWQRPPLSACRMLPFKSRSKISNH